ncbi:MAG TPA: enoyl-CoA hydratase-related protein [Propionibacteriaceae bacterium]
MTDEAVAGPVVRLEVASGVAVLRIDRPKLNALNGEILRGLGYAAAECNRRADIASVVVTGGEQVFAAGADIKEMAALSAAEMEQHSHVLQQSFTAVAGITKPVVAAINGYAVGGGCELALCADLRIAAVDATLGQPEIKLGVIPGAGGTQRLARLVGPSRAKDLVLTGRFVGAAEALAIGLVDRVVPADEVVATASAWAQQFVGGPSVALRAAKECIDSGLDTDLVSGLELERSRFAALFATQDRTIGMTSFVERGPGHAEFVGR